MPDYSPSSFGSKFYCKSCGQTIGCFNGADGLVSTCQRSVFDQTSDSGLCSAFWDCPKFAMEPIPNGFCCSCEEKLRSFGVNV